MRPYGYYDTGVQHAHVTSINANRPKRRCRLWAIGHHFPMDEKVLRVGSDPIHLILSILSFISRLAEGFFAPCLL